MRGHAALARRAHAVALLGVGQDHRRLAAVLRRRGIGGVDLHQVVAAALEPVDLFVGHALREPREVLVLAEEVVAVEASVLGREGLHLPVDGVREGAHQRMRGVAREQAVPVAAPQQLDHIPARAAEQLLQFVDDAAVAAHRTVQALQVAVDHPHQVVQLLARGERQRAGALGLVHLAVAEHAPHLAAAAIEQAAVRQVVHEARVVDRTDGPQPHGPRGELPEVRHQPGMRIAGKPARAVGRRRDLLAVVREVVSGQPALQERTRVDARRAVRLEEHQVAAVAGVARMEEVVEAHLEQVGRARVARDVAPELAVGGVGARHHGQRIPPHQRGELLLDGQVAGKRRLLFHRDGVDVGRDQFRRPGHGGMARQHRQLVEDEARTRRPFGGDERQEGLAPFGRFAGIGVAGRIGEVTGDALVRHGATLEGRDPQRVSKIGCTPRSAA